MLAKQQVTCFLLLISVSCSLAKPYYYFFQADEAAQKAAADAQAAAQSVQQQIKLPEVGQQVDGELKHKISGHLNSLYQHGSSAVKSLADTVQPDFKNIGQDITEVYHVTGERVNKKIEPLAQNVKPYIDQAQKAVERTREEVPKLIHQAGPALTKVGSQVRDGISGVLDKLKSAHNPEPSPAGALQQAGEQVQQAGQQVQQAATGTMQQAQQMASNAIQQPAEAINKISS